MGLPFLFGLAFAILLVGEIITFADVVRTLAPLFAG